MQLGLHAISIYYTNLLTDIRVAQAVGYDALEIWIPKLQRYLDAGNRLEGLNPILGDLRPAVLTCLLNIERQEPEARRELLAQTESLCAMARTLHCPTLQVMALNALRGQPWPELRQKTAHALGELADIAAPYGVRLALEPSSFTPLRTLSQGLEVLDAAGRDNVGLTVDTFHLWTGGTPWDEVAKLDGKLILVAHISDVTPRAGAEWADADRDVLPGDGILPLKEGIAAIRATGYDGLWSVELLGARHWEWEPTDLARELKRRTELLLAD